ncbi:MAG: tetratricopeptide repeat protein [Flavobacteriaceae bacterium]|nr:tetratricopeptide repeat protein [Flavobacteriaceae bacterium]
MTRLLLIILFVLPLSVFSQENKASLQREARGLVRKGNKLYGQEKFSDAEVAYKKAIAKDPNYEIANYNLGVALAEQNRGEEAIAQYELTAKLAENKLTKAEAFHNLGNQHFDTKNYQKSVEAYKNSLRNNPTDDETRYNLALAQKLLEEQQKEDENKENKDDKDNKDNKDKKDGEDKDKDKKEGDDEEDKKDKGDDEKDKKQDPKDEKKDQQKKPKPGQLSPQQMEQLLEAMNNEEKKTQEKMNARKEKGRKVKQEKDW